MKKVIRIKKETIISYTDSMKMTNNKKKGVITNSKIKKNNKNKNSITFMTKINKLLLKSIRNSCSFNPF